MPDRLFRNLTETDKSDAVRRLIEESSPTHDFFLMIVLSVLMATFGLLIDNIPVVIGSMLIAPLLSPVLSFSLAIVQADWHALWRSTYTLFRSLVLAVAASTVVTMLFSDLLSTELTDEIISRTQPSLVFATIGVVAGFAASFAYIKPKLNATLPGVAISVALLPPLAVTGIGIARFEWPVVAGSLLLFAMNSLGIIFASLIVFSLMNLYVKRGVAEHAIQKEERELKPEKKRHPHPIRDLIKAVKKK